MSAVPSAILGIRSDFQVSDQDFSCDLIQSFLMIEDLGMVHLRGTAIGRGRLILPTDAGPVLSDIEEWSFKWRGIFCAWVVGLDDPSLHGFQCDVLITRPNQIFEINGYAVRIHDEQLFPPLLVPLTKYYLGRHARVLFPFWPKVETHELNGGPLLLPPW